MIVEGTKSVRPSCPLAFLLALLTAGALSALAPAYAHAQDQSPTSNFTIEGRFGDAAVRFHAGSAGTFDERLKLQELVELQIRADLLKASNRQWQLPLAIAALGAGVLIAGGVVFGQPWEDDWNQRLDRTGLALMPTGAAMMLVAAPIAIARLSRAFRLRRVERAMAAVRAR